jgi:hypothetical protein
LVPLAAQHSQILAAVSGGGGEWQFLTIFQWLCSVSQVKIDTEETSLSLSLFCFRIGCKPVIAFLDCMKQWFAFLKVRKAGRHDSKVEPVASGDILKIVKTF